jgi:RimJ/RimL family protein N-acetyltransferase
LAETGEKVVLRAPTMDDVSLLDAWRGDPVAEGPYNDFGLGPRGSYRDAVAAGTLTDANGGLLMVIADDEPIGTVTWRRESYGPNPESACWNIGISLVPSGRGRGIGGVAQRLLADHLFETTDVHRIEASTDVTNVPEQRALEKAGFVREGVLRGAQFRAGKHHDMVGYSRLRSDA